MANTQEKIIDREVQRLLRTDSAYLYAADADQQAAREKEIVGIVCAEIEQASSWDDI